MPTFRRGDIVRVPFPYTDRDTQQRRPALVVSNGPVGDGGRLLWVAMITSASNRRWDDDIDISHDPSITGLLAPSLIRPAKLATIDARLASSLGRLFPELQEQVAARIKARL
jgi:mRNA interferase MazF